MLLELTRLSAETYEFKSELALMVEDSVRCFGTSDVDIGSLLEVTRDDDFDCEPEVNEVAGAAVDDSWLTF